MSAIALMGNFYRECPSMEDIEKQFSNRRFAQPSVLIIN